MAKIFAIIRRMMVLVAVFYAGMLFGAFWLSTAPDRLYDLLPLMGGIQYVSVVSKVAVLLGALLIATLLYWGGRTRKA